MMTKILKLGLFIVCTLSMVGCAIMTESKKPLTYPESLPTLGYTFNYNPVKETKSVEAVFALINPTYKGLNYGDISFKISEKSLEQTFKNDEEVRQICDDYLNAIKSDFNETLIAKGYSLLGPFSSLNEMTYGEKEKSILSLIPTLNLRFQFVDNTGAENVEIFSNTSKIITRSQGNRTVLSKKTQMVAKYTGNLIVDGFIELVLVEPLTGEKMWIKQIKVPFENESYYYYAFLEYLQDVDIIGNPIGNLFITNSYLLKQNDFRPRALAKALEKVYITQLESFDKYFDPKEISLVIRDAEKVRKLKRY
ncbi:MAG: hypothetical protein PVH61_36395 [Candidatus Aminicenantes bacterium]|jgi:hypothetical protein